MVSYSSPALRNFCGKICKLATESLGTRTREREQTFMRSAESERAAQGHPPPPPLLAALTLDFPYSPSPSTQRLLRRILIALKPNLSQVHPRSDNARCYHCAYLLRKGSVTGIWYYFNNPKMFLF